MFGKFAAAAVALVLLAGFSVFELSVPAQAQSSCMHCNFAHGKCRQLKKDTPEGCKAQHTKCVKVCKGEAADAPKQSDKAKAAGSQKKN